MSLYPVAFELSDPWKPQTDPLASSWPASATHPPTSPPRPSPTNTSPASSTAGFGWNVDLSRQLAAKLLLVSQEEQPASASSPSNTRFKTEICRNIKEKGTCLYGDLCQFAHGKDEVRDVVKHNKYKTKLCQKYWIAGYCAYGPRCNFIHYENESSPSKTGCTPPATPSYLPPSGSLVRTAADVINMANTDAVINNRKKSVDESGDSSFESDNRTPSLSPPSQVQTSQLQVQVGLHTPTYGSGRMIARMNNDSYTWVDTWTQKFI